ncbi:MAG: hypothetical protein JRF33_18025 [Deltaproteobacteria bacterium]|nr:hypothetical protein [Deltaproteobacteria bacterium]
MARRLDSSVHDLLVRTGQDQRSLSANNSGTLAFADLGLAKQTGLRYTGILNEVRVTIDLDAVELERLFFARIHEITVGRVGQWEEKPRTF